MKQNTLRIAEDLALPLETVTQKLAWLGVTGSGKTYGASKLAELMWDAGAQFVVIDPVGVWYGLRLAKDGKTPSDITIPIFGGLHGDVPLEPTAGALIANLIVDRGISAILDISQFEYDTDKARFADDFAARFFFRKKAAPSAVHLFLEECQELVPQNPQKGEERMLHRFIRLQKLGRNFGIGSSYISQRPQEVNKKALNMAQTLFVFRTTGTHERAAIEKWIEDKALDQDIAGDLPKIPTGTCHAWSPEFLKISETIRIAEKRTFNASSTPEVGARASTRHLAPIDLKKIAADMSATIERAKETDPDELKKRIAEQRRRITELERQTAKPTPTTKEKAIDPEKFREAVKKESDLALVKTLRPVYASLRTIPKSFAIASQAALNAAASITRIEEAVSKAVAEVDALKAQAEGIERAGVVVGELQPTAPRRAAVPFQPRLEAQPRHPPKPEGNGRDDADEGQVGRGALRRVGRGALRRILVALAQHPEGLSYRKIGVFSGVSTKGGSFSTYLSRARRPGWIVGDDRDGVRITREGLDALGDFDPLPSGNDLLLYWLRELGGGATGKILRVVAGAYPDALSHEEISARANVSINGGSYSTYLSRLRSRDLIIGSKEIRLSEDLVG